MINNDMKQALLKYLEERGCNVDELQKVFAEDFNKGLSELKVSLVKAEEKDPQSESSGEPGCAMLGLVALYAMFSNNQTITKNQ